MFSDQVNNALVSAANANGIEPACLLALVEVETGGKLFEEDGETPQLLFERHICWREATKASCLPAFQEAGLAIPHWDRATQYKDQRTSAERLDLIQRARAINEEVANRSASWGLGQTMGFLAEELGFSSATEMVRHQATIDGQIDCMLREIKKSHLVEPLNSHDWAHVARIYNGPAYAENQYDTRLANAYASWARKMATASDLRAEGSRTIKQAQRTSVIAKVTTAAGIGGAADQAGLLDTAKETLGQLGDFRGMAERVGDMAGWAKDHWWLFALAIGLMIAYRAEKIIEARVDDHRTGANTGR